MGRRSIGRASVGASFGRLGIGYDTPVLVFDFSPGPRRVFGRPLEVIRADRLGEVAGAFAAVQRAVSGGLYAAGFVAYEAAPAFDEALRTHPPARCRSSGSASTRRRRGAPP